MKHAYLIMAHNEPQLLKLLIEKLDYKDHDIYVHLDKKSKLMPEDLVCDLKYSSLFFIPRIKVYWGHYSQIQCEIDLLKAAVKEKYDYYHLITGVDLPLKSNEEIANFFESHREKEFVDFDKNDNLTKKFYSRFERFHFRKRRFFKNKLLKFFFFSLEAIGELLGFVIGAFFGKRHKRFSRNATFMKGSAYFDITHDLADYIVNQEQLIKKLYCYSICCDEVFLQTIVYNSPFKEKVTDINTRYIDWNTHANNPKTLTIDDYNSIKKSNCLFARKFSSTQSRDLIKKLYDYEV